MCGTCIWSARVVQHSCLQGEVRSLLNVLPHVPGGSPGEVGGGPAPNRHGHGLNYEWWHQ